MTRLILFISARFLPFFSLKLHRKATGYDTWVYRFSVWRCPDEKGPRVVFIKLLANYINTLIRLLGLITFLSVIEIRSCIWILTESCLEKTCNWNFRPGPTQPVLLQPQLKIASYCMGYMINIDLHNDSILLND